MICPEINKSFTLIAKEKLYCYSKLMHNNHNDIQKTKEGITNIRNCYFIFTTPYDFLDLNILKECFIKKKIFFNLENQTIELFIEKIELLNERPITQHFTCISPIVVNEKSYLESTKCIEYHPEKDNRLFVLNLKNNLLHKYNKVHHTQNLQDFDFNFSFDDDYIARKKSNISKLITFESRKIKAYEAPFIITAPQEIIDIAYKCGLGDNNNIGFGCIEAVKK